MVKRCPSAISYLKRSVDRHKKLLSIVMIELELLLLLFCRFQIEFQSQQKLLLVLIFLILLLINFIYYLIWYSFNRKEHEQKIRQTITGLIFSVLILMILDMFILIRDSFDELKQNIIVHMMLSYFVHQSCMKNFMIWFRKGFIIFIPQVLLSSIVVILAIQEACAMTIVIAFIILCQTLFFYFSHTKGLILMVGQVEQVEHGSMGNLSKQEEENQEKINEAIPNENVAVELPHLTNEKKGESEQPYLQECSMAYGLGHQVVSSQMINQLKKSSKVLSKIAADQRAPPG